MPPPSHEGSFPLFDSIRNLPPDIIMNILSRLPIRDAIGTCVLSRQWRYKWCSITRLVFKDGCVRSGSDDDISFDTAFARAIDSVLLLHQGLVHKFDVSVRYIPQRSNIIQWVCFLSRNGIKELSLSFGKHFRMPSSLFQCSKLTRLNLSGCEISGLPVGLEGFVSLKISMVVISDDSLDKLLSGCPLLERLELYDTVGGVLKINAPRLKYLFLEGLSRGFFVEKTPLLEELLVQVSPEIYVYERVVINFLSRVNSLQKLVGVDDFTKFFNASPSIGAQIMIHHHFQFHDNLQVIELHVDFNDPSQVLLLLQLIDRSTSLKELEISILGPEWWREARQRQRDFTQLKKVEMTMVSVSPNEIEFIRLLLLCSPALETMVVSPFPNLKKVGKNALAKLLKGPRASARAKIVYTMAVNPPALIANVCME